MTSLLAINGAIDGDLIMTEGDLDIVEVLPLHSRKHHYSSITWLSDDHFAQLDLSLGTNVIVSSSCFEANKQAFERSNLNIVPVKNARSAFKKMIDMFFAVPSREPKISSTAVVDASVFIPESCFIGEHVVIENDVKVGAGCIIDHNTVIKAGTVLKEHVKIGCNTTIGNFGFGYQPNENGEYEVIHHLGNVEIENNSEIGNNVAIDRAVLGSTLIGENVKIDNLVHISHGVTIGSNSLIIANAMIAGSVEIGKNCWIAPSSSILQKKKIGDGALIGLGSVVRKDVSSDDVVAGVPAVSIRKRH